MTTFTTTVVDTHSIFSHTDTTATGAELDTLTDGSDAGALHTHTTFAALTLTGTLAVGDQLITNVKSIAFNDGGATITQVDDGGVATGSATRGVTQNAVKTYVDATVSDNTYADAWNAVTTIAPSKNATYDKFYSIDDNLLALEGIVTIEGTWDASGAAYPVGPSQGDAYIISVAGTIDGVDYKVWDWMVYTTNGWKRIYTFKADLIVRVTTNDTLQDFIDMLEAAGGGVIILESGTHGSNDAFPLTINDVDANIEIRGQGDNSIIDVGENETVINATNFTELTLRNFKVDCNDYTDDTKHGIIINDVGDHPCLIEGVHVTGDGTHGFGISLYSDNITVRNCEVDNMDDGIRCHTGAYTQIIGNYVHDNEDYGIWAGAQAGVNIIIEGNNVVDNGGYGLKLECDNGILRGNISDGNETGLYILDSDYVVVSDNVVINNTLHGIYITNANYSVFKGNVSGKNDSNDAGATYGFYIGGTSQYCSVMGNTVCQNNNAGAGTGYGFFQDGVNNATRFVGNTINGNDDNTNYDEIAKYENIGVANAAYFPMITAGGHNSNTYWKTAGLTYNTGANDFIIVLELPIPCNKGGLKLYITKCQIAIADADATDYLNAMYVRGITAAGITNLYNDGTNRIAAGTYTYTFPAAVDCSAYLKIFLRCDVFSSSNEQFDLANCAIECYYDT